MNRHSYLAALLCAGVLSACSKDPVRDISGPPPAASRIRFFNFGVNAPGVNFYANETKMTAITNSTAGVEATTGIAYGGVGAGGAYEAIAPGQYTLTGKIAATTDKDLSVSPLATTIADGKYYSYYMSGFYNTTTKTVESFVVEDPVTPPTDFTLATVRFVHAVSNANPMTLYAKLSTPTTSTPVAIGAEVAYKNAGAFTQIPAGVYDLSTRYTGSATSVMTRTGVSFVGGRVYTITARGDITVASSPTACGATNKTCLDNTANR
jgi:hypothetical protein